MERTPAVDSTAYYRYRPNFELSFDCGGRTTPPVEGVDPPDGAAFYGPVDDLSAIRRNEILSGSASRPGERRSRQMPGRSRSLRKPDFTFGTVNTTPLIGFYAGNRVRGRHFGGWCLLLKGSLLFRAADLFPGSRG